MEIDKLKDGFKQRLIIKTACKLELPYLECPLENYNCWDSRTVEKQDRQMKHRIELKY